MSTLADCCGVICAAECVGGGVERRANLGFGLLIEQLHDGREVALHVGELGGCRGRRCASALHVGHAGADADVKFQMASRRFAQKSSVEIQGSSAKLENTTEAAGMSNDAHVSRRESALAANAQVRHCVHC